MVHLYLKANSFDFILELSYTNVIKVLIMRLMTSLYNRNSLPCILLSLIPITLSGVFAAFVFFPSLIAFNISPVLILYSCILSVLVTVITYKIISNNRKTEIEKNKSLQKEQELIKEKQQLEEKIQELENKITVRDNLIDQLIPKEANDRENEIRELKSKIDDLNNKNVELNKKIGQLENEKYNFSVYNDELTKENEKLRNKTSELKSQLCELRDITKREIEEFKKKLNESFNQKLQEETSLQNVKVNKLQEKITQLQRTLEKKTQEIKQLNAQLNSKEELNQSLERKITDIDNEKKKLLSYLDEAKKQNEKLQDECDNHIKDLSELRKKNDSLSNQIRKQMREHSDLENKNLSLKRDVQELEAEIDKLRKKNIELGEEIKKLKLNASSKSKGSDISRRDNDNSQSLNDRSSDPSEFEEFGEVDKQSFQKPQPPFTSTPKKLKSASFSELSSKAIEVQNEKTPLNNMGDIKIQDNNNQCNRSLHKSDKDKENSRLHKSSIINRSFNSSLRINNLTASHKTM